MTLETIYKLLRSRSHEDRALGIEYLEQIPNYIGFFTEIFEDDSQIHTGERLSPPTTHIFTNDHEYWVCVGRIILYTGTKNRSGWGPAEKTIKI